MANMILHNAEANNYNFLNTFQYLDACTETWTYDTTYGAYIGYKIQDDSDTTIYEYSIELDKGTEIPGYTIPFILGISVITMISLVYIMKKKK